MDPNKNGSKDLCTNTRHLPTGTGLPQGQGHSPAAAQKNQTVQCFPRVDSVIKSNAKRSNYPPPKKKKKKAPGE